MRGDRSERGAALVEYALLVALVVGVAMGAIDLLGRAADAELERSARGASGTEWSGGDDDPDGTDDEGAGPSPTSNPAATSTTSTRPTTTAPPVVASVSFTDVRSWSTGWFQWSGSAAVVLVDARGRPLGGAEVQVRITTSGGQVETATITTDGTGRAVVEVGPYAWFGSWGGTGHVDVEAVGVDPTTGTWDGTRASVTVSAP